MSKQLIYEPGNKVRHLVGAGLEPPIRNNSMDVVYKWKPKKILLMISPFNTNVQNVVEDLVSFIKEQLHSKVVIYDKFVKTETSETDQLWGEVQEIYKGEVVTKFKDDPDQLLDIQNVDLIITLGGDGTILRVNKMFPEDIPPVIGLSLGSLGYLAKFNLNMAKETLSSIETRGFKISMRSQLQITIIDEKGEPIIHRNALNECVIDRGLSPYITTLDVYYDGKYFTTVSGDGLMLGTPSGSTAYSMSAGGSIVHPDVPAMLFTVICPHSISYRPLVFPCSAKIEVVIPPDNRGYVRVCVDGNYSCNVRHGSSIRITSSHTYFPLVLPKDTETTNEWCRSLKDHLHWNVRIRQQKLHIPPDTKAEIEECKNI
ncbi:conserved hypothetical protein [Theileria equi strain WA]|uniref:NAD(+) kinase n=1 Tax=Theileria equi strain WA TaxID=1537102 RepID=L1LC20_THEEQ|nr:conserved hypothetical protein [Theileria equi strain WA]EKX72886.1 conserved hypothetical protein [Theileria equi strain WA]|eukprot:XP_004832338.1 conserved hypothetical protein [Theileria equi strain WA]